MIRRLALLVGALSLAACSTHRTEPVAIHQPPPPLEAGVSEKLAQWRASIVSQVEYDLSMSIPPQMDAPIPARMALRFDMKAVAGDLPLDFREDGDKLQALRINGKAAAIQHEAEHLILPASHLRKGANEVELLFEAGDSSLNRNPDFLYTLFVPDRARTMFPLFDQPDLKARYRLTIEAPSAWKVMANAPLAEVQTDAGRTTRAFAQSEPLASYLFSFVAGDFQSETRTVGGREMTMLHRETDPEKYARNVDAIFDLHSEALAWMEEYSGIAYPFAKFDFVVIPGFPYGGMEHPGAIQYRDRSLFLDEDPSQPRLLNRASLIAHETAHMWFGDLVTMRWFDDVWTKEVFANFMAAKIVNPSFPEVDHELNFLLDHYPSAYAVDRTQGANAIRQPLANLDQAGSLYGAIIYDKAPIMMRQLELLLGEEAFQDGMREYLATYAGGNATWPDLISIFDKRSEEDLAAWSEVWVNTPGRPHYHMSNTGELHQVDPARQGRIWAQEFANRPDGPKRVLFNSDGMGYGLFPVDLAVSAKLWDELSDLEKGAQLVNLNEQMLEGDGGVGAEAYYDFLSARLASQDNELLLDEMLGQMSRIYWTLMSPEARGKRAPAIEVSLYALIDNETLPTSTRKLALGALEGFAMTPQTLDRLGAIWSGEEKLVGITLSERERIDLAASLAIKRPDRAGSILDAQAARIENPDEQRRFAFLRPSLSPVASEREAFFASLSMEENRATESWVLDALGYLHHPLRTDISQNYVARSLEWLEEIQRTGDIFFPAGWISRTLRNHTEPAVAATVRDFLADRPDYNPQLRLKILQAADPLFRSIRIREGTETTASGETSHDQD